MNNTALRRLHTSIIRHCSPLFVLMLCTLFLPAPVPSSAQDSSPPQENQASLQGVADIGLKFPFLPGSEWQITNGVNGHNDPNNYKNYPHLLPYNINAVDFVPVGHDCAGEPVLAAAPGVIEQTDSGNENRVLIDHENGYHSLYTHLASPSPLSVDTRVSYGTVIGTCGNSGISRGPHIHFAVCLGKCGYNNGVVPVPIDGITDANRLNTGNRGLYSTNSATPPTPPLNQNLIKNGDFNADMNGWRIWGDARWAVYADSNNNKVLHFKRDKVVPEGGSVVQDLPYRPATSVPVEIAIDLGNSSGVAKDVSIILHDQGSWTGAVSCRFTIPPNAPLQQYVIRGRTAATQWNGMQLELWPESNDGIPDLRADNVSLMFRQDINPTTTQCITEEAVRPKETACYKPFLRYYHDGLKRHFYTSIWNEARISTNGWRYERTEGYVAANSTCHPGATLPLYRLYHDTLQKHFYTSSASEKDYVITNYGYRLESIVGYVFPAPGSNSHAVPLYRAYHEVNKDHFYTINKAEYDAALPLGYTGESHIIYVLKDTVLSSPTPVPTSPTTVTPVPTSPTTATPVPTSPTTTTPVPTSPTTLPGGHSLKPINGAIGAPGSIFALRAEGFTAERRIKVSINGIERMTLTIPTGGVLIFAVFFSEQTPPGTYTIVITEEEAGTELMAPLTAQAVVTIAADATRVEPSEKPTVVMPANPSVYLPLVLR